MRQTVVGMNGKTVKTAIAGILALLALGSWFFFAVAVTRPGTDYDPEKVRLDVKLHSREKILTCAYKVYGDDTWEYWVGKTVIKNVGSVPVHDVKFSYRVAGYSEWSTNRAYPEILPGETVRDFYFPVLDGEKVMSITTRTPAELVMRYEYRGLPGPVEERHKIFFLARNDFTFSSLREEDKVTLADREDNYPFIAAFCTPNEETTKSFAQMATGGLAPSSSDEDAVSALWGVYNTMVEHGVRYVHEPAAFWAGESAQYVQFPKETINRKAGTCLDLAICIASMMEAVGVKSFVIFLPGHALPAIELPESGQIVPIESTGIEYGDVFPPEEAIKYAQDELDDEDNFPQTWIDLELWWEKGVVPPW